MAGQSSVGTKPIVDLIGRRLSTATVLFHTAVADRMGVSVTDAKCRSLLLLHGPMTAGELSARLGLTTGAVTGVIDRLAAAHMVERAPDAHDRRRVVVKVVQNPQRDLEIAQLFRPMAMRIRALAGGYDPSQQAILFEFLTKASEVLEEETRRLRAKPRMGRRTKEK